MPNVTPPRCALVTGATSEIGSGIVSKLLAQGTKVYAVGSSESTVAALRTKFKTEGALLNTRAADLRQPDAAIGLLASLDDEPDLFIHGAGRWHDQSRAFRDVDVDETPLAEIEDVLAIGLLSAVRLAHGVLPAMKRRGGGRIILTSCGYAGPHEASGWLHYYLSNQALNALTRGLAAECRPYGIQVNAIAPWFVATDPVRRFFPEDAAKALSPETVAELVGFLLTDVAGAMSGQVLEIRSSQDH